jgi:hypothetical protein
VDIYEEEDVDLMDIEFVPGNANVGHIRLDDDSDEFDEGAFSHDSEDSNRESCSDNSYPDESSSAASFGAGDCGDSDEESDHY